MRHLFRMTAALLLLGLPSLASAQDKFFDSNGVQIRYVEQGSGTPIVLVHGFTNSIERGWIDVGVLANLANIVGYSQGGRIVVKLLTTHPERFLTATLGGSAGFRNWTAEDDRAMEAEAAEIERGSFRALILSVAPTDRPTPTDGAIQLRSQTRRWLAEVLR